MENEDQADSDKWILAQGEEEELPLIFRVREDPPAGIETADYPMLINIYWHYEPGREQGMPGDDDADGMERLEESLDGIEGAELGYLMMTVLGNARKEWIWYVKSAEAFLAGLNQQLAGQEPFPIELDSGEDPKWESYFGLRNSMQGG